MCRIVAMALAVLISSTAVADEIPLKRIWAWKMPGTKDVQKLDSLRTKESPIAIIRRALRPASNDVKQPPPRTGFAVVGEGRDALLRASELITSDKVPDSFPPNAELSIAFLSRETGSYVHLDRVDRKDNVIEVRYRFVPHLSTDVTEHFALIPMGVLSPGKYQVKYIQLPMDQSIVKTSPPQTNPDWEKDLICKPFSFTIKDESN